jgi:hypothetical protein
MHRSGTSAFAGALDRLGVDFSNNMIDTLPENPKGFFENRAINHLDIEILNFFKTEWYRIVHFWKIDSLTLAKEKFGQKIREIIDTEFGTSEIIGIKEPRMSLFIPLYLAVLKEHNIAYRIVVIHRNDFEVANSLRKRNNFSLLHGVLLSKFYKHYIQQFTKEEAVFSTSFDKFLNDPITTLKALCEYHHLPLDMGSRPVENVASFIDKNLRHNKIRQGVLKTFKRALILLLAEALLLYSRVLKVSFFVRPGRAKNIGL